MCERVVSDETKCIGRKCNLIYYVPLCFITISFSLIPFIRVRQLLKYTSRLVVVAVMITKYSR